MQDRLIRGCHKIGERAIVVHNESEPRSRHQGRNIVKMVDQRLRADVGHSEMSWDTARATIDAVSWTL